MPRKFRKEHFIWKSKRKCGKKYTERNLNLEQVLSWIKNELKAEVKSLDAQDDDMKNKGYNGKDDEDGKNKKLASKGKHVSPGGPQI